MSIRNNQNLFIYTGVADSCFQLYLGWSKSCLHWLNRSDPSTCMSAQWHVLFRILSHWWDECCILSVVTTYWETVSARMSQITNRIENSVHSSCLWVPWFVSSLHVKSMKWKINLPLWYHLNWSDRIHKNALLDVTCWSFTYSYK